MVSKRNTHIDNLKGIGIILVMLGHALPSAGYAHNLIYGFHMPLFFFCSGVFYKKKPIAGSIVKDLRALMIPWFTFCLFLVMCSYVLMVLSNGSCPKFRPLDENCYVLYYTIWFLPCLFITRFIYRVIEKHCNVILTSICVLLSYWGAYLLKSKDINLPFFVDSALGMLFYFHLGHLSGKKLQEIEENLEPKIGILLLMSYAAFVWIFQPLVNIKDNLFPISLVSR